MDVYGGKDTSLSWGQRAEGMESQADAFELYFINHRKKIGLVNGVSRTSADEGAPRMILPSLCFIEGLLDRQGDGLSEASLLVSRTPGL